MNAISYHLIKKTTLTLMCLAPLTACDNRSIEQLHADRIAACREMIRTTKPMRTDHLPPTKRGKEIDFNGKWESCRAKVEDRELDGEVERFPDDFDFKKFTYRKLGGKFIRIPRNVSTYTGIWVPYTWQHDYPAGEARAQSKPIKKGQKGGVLFLMHSTNSARYKRVVEYYGRQEPDYTEVCKDLDKKPHTGSTLVWNGIFFGALISNKQGRQEWPTLCPEVVKIVSQFQEIELKPLPIYLKQEDNP